MPRRKKKQGEHADERWLLTYADMITLLLAIFVILFSMSSIDAGKYDTLASALSKEFRGAVFNNDRHVIGGSPNTLTGASAITGADAARVIQNQSAESGRHTSLGLAREEERLSKYVKEQGLSDKIEITTNERGIVVRLAGDAFFASGSDTMNPKMEEAMRFIANDLRTERRQVSVEGHTDGQPIGRAGGRFVDNLDLSASRAMTIYRYLVTEGVRPERMRVVGFADARPLKKPTFREQPVAKNRRVEIVILAPGGDKPGGSPLAQGSTGKAPAKGDPQVAAPSLVEPISPVIVPIIEVSRDP